MSTMVEYDGRANSGVSKRMAGVIGEEFAAMEKAGVKLSPQNVVEAARDQKSRLHPFFDWDDARAAERYRKLRARYLISNYVILKIETGERLKPVYSVNLVTASTPKGERAFHAREIVLSDLDGLAQVSRGHFIRFRAMVRDLMHTGLSNSDPYWKGVVQAAFNGKPMAVRESDQP